MDSPQNPKRIHDLRSALTRLEFFLKLVENPEEAKRLSADPKQWAALVASAQSAVDLLKKEIESS